MEHAEYLPHLSTEVVIEARGPELDAYVIALEGWRRGLTLKWFASEADEFPDIPVWNVERPGKLFSLSDGVTTRYFFRTRSEQTSADAVKACMDKQVTKEKLEQAGVPVPKGEKLSGDAEFNKAEAAASAIGYPVVVKPVDGSFGRGVYMNIQSALELESVWSKVNADDAEDYIIESYIPGDEYRVFVLEDRVIGVMKRVPANVTGDGTKPISQLIHEKNRIREENPRLYSCPIIINDDLHEEISKHGLTIDSILEKDRTLTLTQKSNISLGGDPHSVELDRYPALNKTAVDALAAMEGIAHGAVDIIFNETTEQTSVLELNPTPQIGSLLFPMEGKAHDVPTELIDYYFPTTKGENSDGDKLYFDLNDVLFPLKSNTAAVTTVSPAYVGEIIQKKFTLYGEVEQVSFHRGLRKLAFERSLSGYVMAHEGSSIEVVVTGLDMQMIKEFKSALLEDERASIIHVREEEIDIPVKIGFEVKADLKLQVEELDFLKKEIIATEKRYRQELKKNRRLRKSLSWKIAAPVRLAGDVAKKLRIRK